LYQARIAGSGIPERLAFTIQAFSLTQMFCLWALL